MSLFIARQPIFDRNLEVCAYELLFRSGAENFFAHHDADEAASQVIDDGLALGLVTLTGGRPAFINVTRRVLVDGLIAVLPPTSTVVEILETVEADAEVLAACLRLKQAGYRIALDDFVLRPEIEPLARLADIIKVDFLATAPPERQRIAEHFAGRGLWLLAEKVETREELEEAQRCGYTHFQGYFFCRPEMVAKKNPSASKLGYLQFLRQVHRPELDFDALERVIKKEVALSLKLLRLLNSAALGLGRKISSIRQGLILLGEQPIKRWASLVALSGLSDDKPAELVVTAMARARFCELMAPDAQLRGRELDLFLIGMLSVVDALIDRPMGQLLTELPVSDEVRAVLLGGAHGRLAEVYELVQACERGDWAQIAWRSPRIQVAEARICAIYTESLRWADQLVHP